MSEQVSVKLCALAAASICLLAPSVTRAEIASPQAAPVLQPLAHRDTTDTNAVQTVGNAGEDVTGAKSLEGGDAGPASASAAPAITLDDLRERYNRNLYDGIRGLLSSEVPGKRIVGDNNDPWGMTWTKCTNLGIHLISTLVAEKRGLVEAEEAAREIREIVDILSQLDTYRGIFPENIKIRGGIVAEVVDGRSRFSSIDSAWVTVALSLAEARYKGTNDALAADAGALVAKQDYRTFVGKDGLLGAGFFVDVASKRKVEDIEFSYADRNSEARPLVLALVGMGQLPASAWNKTYYRWGEREGLSLARGWHFSAFVEMTGALFFDEARLAPRTLGKSHENYIEATVRVAQRNGHRMWGYAPACDAQNAYAEFGLDRPDSVTPYAAGLLTLTENSRAIQNLDAVLGTLPSDGRALPDGLDPATGAVSCGVARLLDQGLLFMALNADVVRSLVRATPWYPSAERRLTAMDRTIPPPPRRKRSIQGLPLSSLDEPTPEAAFVYELLARAD